MQKLYSVKEIASFSGLTDKRIRQLGPELIRFGHAQKVGKVLVLADTAIDYIQNRPDGRGKLKDEPSTEKKISPNVSALVGILKGKDVSEEDYRAYLREKYL